MANIYLKDQYNAICCVIRHMDSWHITSDQNYDTITSVKLIKCAKVKSSFEKYKIQYILDIHVNFDNKNGISLGKHYNDIHSENDINITHQYSPNRIWTLNYINVHQIIGKLQ
jgi:hypothetical protein